MCAQRRGSFAPNSAARPRPTALLVRAQRGAARAQQLDAQHKEAALDADADTEPDDIPSLINAIRKKLLGNIRCLLPLPSTTYSHPCHCSSSQVVTATEPVAPAAVSEKSRAKAKAAVSKLAYLLVS
jgi:hypothetical protein